jgi:hypothetical protein
VLQLTRVQAALCALRILKKVPDLLENYTGKVKNLLTDRNHGVLLTGCTLAVEICGMSANCLEDFRNVRLDFMLYIEDLNDYRLSLFWCGTSNL